jgi:DNA-binding CsgD family transcriptional regulator
MLAGFDRGGARVDFFAGEPTDAQSDWVDDGLMQRLRATQPATPETVRLPSPPGKDAGAEGQLAFGVAVTVVVGTRKHVLVVGRPAALGSFTAAETSAMARLAPFLERAIRNRRARGQAASENNALRQVINQTRRGFLFLDAERRLLFANRVALTHLASKGALQVRSGRLQAHNGSDQRRFRDAIERAISQPEDQSVVILRGAGDGVRVVATVTGISSPQAAIDGELSDAAVIIRLSPAAPGRGELKPGYLESIFGFTPKEAEIVALLVGGLELSDAARELNIGYETARQYMKSVFSKTNLRRQRDLLHLVRLSLPFLPVPSDAV